MGLFSRSPANGGNPNDERFDELARACGRGNSQEAGRAFWSAMFAHDEWCFLPDAQSLATQTSGTPPLLGFRDPQTGRFFQAVFTSRERALDYYRSISENPLAREAVAISVMDALGAVSRLAPMGPEVSGVIVNYDPTPGSFSPTLTLDQLVTNFEYDTGYLPESAWPRFYTGVANNGSEIGWGRLLGQLLSLESWVVPVFEHDHSRPLFHSQSDGEMLVMYTHPSYAQIASQRGLIPGSRDGAAPGAEEVALRTFMVPRADALRNMETIAAGLNGRRLHALFNAGVEAMPIPFETLRGAFASAA